MKLHSESLWEVGKLSNCSPFLSVAERRNEKAGFVPLSPSVSSAEEMERFSSQDLAGLPILGASKGLWELSGLFPLLLPAAEESSHKELLHLFPSNIQAYRAQIHLCNQRKASIWEQLKISQSSLTCAPVHRKDPRTPEHLNYQAAVVHTKGKTCHT